MATTKLNNGQLPTTLSSMTIDNTNDINTTTTRLKITGGSSGQVLSTDGSGNLSWTTAGGGVADGDKGDITVSASGATWTIDNDAVTYAKIQNVTTNRLLGRVTAGSGDTEEITIGNGLSVSGTTLSALGAPIAIVTKSADETVTSSATLQDDDHLTYTFPLEDRLYYIFINIAWRRSNTTAAVSARYGGKGTSQGTLRRLNDATPILIDRTGNLTAGAVSLSIGVSTTVYHDPAIVMLRSSPTVQTTFTLLVS